MTEKQENKVILPPPAFYHNPDPNVKTNQVKDEESKILDISLGEALMKDWTPPKIDRSKPRYF